MMGRTSMRSCRGSRCPAGRGSGWPVLPFCERLAVRFPWFVGSAELTPSTGPVSNGVTDNPAGANQVQSSKRGSSRKRGRNALTTRPLSDDAAVLQFILNRIDHIGMRRGNSIFKASVLSGTEFERKLMTLVLIEKAGDDDGGHRAGIIGEACNKNER